MHSLPCTDPAVSTDVWRVCVVGGGGRVGVRVSLLFEASRFTGIRSSRVCGFNTLLLVTRFLCVINDIITKWILSCYAAVDNLNLSDRKDMLDL